MELMGVMDRDILARSEINQGVIPFLNKDAVIQEEQEVISCLAETGGPIFWSLFVRSGRGRVGRSEVHRGGAGCWLEVDHVLKASWREADFLSRRRRPVV